MADTLRETIAVHPTEPGSNTFTAPPFFARARAGNAAPIAFGGIALSQAVSAAFRALPPTTSASGQDYHIFSIQGSYLGPASTEVPTTFTVEDIRTTRTMVTRLVTASQNIPPKPSSDPGASRALINRKVLICLIDFHRPEPAFLSYSAPPLHSGTYPPPMSLATTEANFETLPFPPDVLKVFKTQFTLPLRMYEYRPVMTSAGAQNSLGFLQVKTTQDDMEFTKRTSSNWIRAREPLETYAERCAGLAFIMDTTLSFLPLALSSIPLTAARAVSSLDFSLRFFSPPPVAIESDWLLHEQYTQRADEGRTFSVGRMYTEDGTEVARMSQVSILRGPEGVKAKGTGSVQARL